MPSCRRRTGWGGRCGWGGGRLKDQKCDRRASPASSSSAASLRSPPHPALRATFSPSGRRTVPISAALAEARHPSPLRGEGGSRSEPGEGRVSSPAPRSRPAYVFPRLAVPPFFPVSARSSPPLLTSGGTPEANPPNDCNKRSASGVPRDGCQGHARALGSHASPNHSPVGPTFRPGPDGLWDAAGRSTTSRPAACRLPRRTEGRRGRHQARFPPLRKRPKPAPPASPQTIPVIIRARSVGRR